MSATKGDQAALTSWAGTHIRVAKYSPLSLQVNETADVFDTTTLGQAYRSMIPGLRSATASINGRLTQNPTVGNAGQIVLTDESYYNDDAGDDAVIGFVGYTLNFNWNVLEVTSSEDASSTWKTFCPGELSWGGTIDLRLDDTEALVNAQGAGGSSLTAVFTLLSGHTFSGEIFVTGQNQGASVGAVNTQQFTFEGTGVCTAAGDDGLFAAGAVPDGDALAAGSLVATFASGRTVTGDAFPSAVSISVPRSGLIEASVTAQYTGALTKA